MRYESTRGKAGSVASAEAIKLGIAPDGGLFVPEKIVQIAMTDIRKMADLDYINRTAGILRLYLDDYTDVEIYECAAAAYNLSRFDHPDIAPLRKLNDHVFMLELWHGPTCAFKDMALQLMPHLLVRAVHKTGEANKIVILVATSGDTGKAALEGFKDIEGTEIIVFYPKRGVSRVQELQMITQEGSNVHVVAVDGNFDDAQKGVKEIFADAAYNDLLQDAGFSLTSANSINWGRLVPQIIYYFSAYASLIARNEIKPGTKINIAVPTGNFGDILAAFYAGRMGLPVNRLICASNMNNVLTEFINTGVYDRKRDFYQTMSPAMDILVSSNLERLLYEVTGHDAQPVADWMAALANNGMYSVDQRTFEQISSLFWAGYSNEEETLKTIESIYREYDYVVDTHTAVGIDVYDKYVISTCDVTKTVITSTASPFKFNESVAKAILKPDSIQGMDEFRLLEMLSVESRMPIPAGLKDLDKKQVRHVKTCGKNDMKQTVSKILGI